jgi:N-acyl homoserine lactone hydrolase
MLRLHVFNTGWAAVQEKHLYVGGSAATRIVPVLSFVIEYPQGFIVFDTGLNPAFAARPRQYIGWPGNSLFPFRSLPGMNLSAQMQARGLAPEKVSHVVLSHLHYDHTGDLRAFPQARLLVSRLEWQAAQSPFRRWMGYLDKEYRGLAVSLLDFPMYNGQTPSRALKGNYGLDLLEDGSLIVIPTFGHTQGHQSLLVFLPYGVVLLAGDAVYVQENYAKPATQPHAHFPESAWRTLIGLRALVKGDPTAVILPTHDDSILRKLQRSDIVIGDAYPVP